MKFEIVFVCGIGRSGTHFIARFLKQHKSVFLRLEKPSTFRPIVKLATEGFDDDAFEGVVRKLKRQQWRRRLVVEKSHPSLWMMDALIEAFPNAGFIGTRRPVLQVVNSMLKHEGVMRWYDTLPMDRPNPFLGITEDNVADFAGLPAHLKCTWKWISHMKQLDACALRYPKNFKVWGFEDLISNPQSSMDEICSFMGIENTRFAEVPDPGTLKKFHHLSEGDQASILRLVEQHLPEYIH